MLKKAREKARKQRQRLKNSKIQGGTFDVYKYLDRIKEVKIGHKFTREEMNDR